MSELGDLLVLMHDARRRVTTVRATVRGWVDQTAAQEVMRRHAGRAGDVLYADGEEPGGRKIAENVARLWLAPGDWVREEREESGQAWFGVRRGGLWWHYDQRSGAMSNEDEPDTGSGIGEEFRWLLDAAPLMGALEFGEITDGLCAGRPTRRVSAVPRRLADGEDWPLVRLGAAGAHQLLLDVDGERGILLRIESRFAQRPIAISEVVEIAFDESFPEEVFQFTPPAGEQIISFKERHRIEHDLTIEQAVALAPFTVWIASRVAADWDVAVTVVAEGRRPPSAPHVLIRYAAPDGMHSLQIAQSPADHPGEHADYEQARANPWETVERDQRTIEIREKAESWQSAQARVELDGTLLLIHSENLSADALADLAGGLIHAPANPPHFGV